MQMINRIKDPLHRALRWSEKYTKTDMVHFFSANFWINASRFISIGIGMLLTVAFANLLSPETFGTYKYVIASAGFIATFSLSGLITATTRAAAQGKMHVIPIVMRTATLWSLPASIAALLGSAYYFWNGNEQLGFAFLFIGITNSITNSIGTTKGIWQATGNFRVGALAGLPKIIVPPLIVLATIIVTENIVWILFAYFASNLLASWLGYIFLRWWFGIKSSPEDTAEVIRFGKQMTMLGFFQLASGQIDQLLLWHFTTPATLAVYALALAPVNEAQNLLNNFLSILFPKIATKSEEDVHKTLPLRLKQMFFAAVILTVLYILLVPFLFKYLFPKYLGAVVVSQVLALTILLQPKGVIDTFFTAHAMISKRVRTILISQVIEFALFFILIPLFGLWGAVAATISSEVVAALIFIYIYFKTRKATLNLVEDKSLVEGEGDKRNA